MTERTHAVLCLYDKDNRMLLQHRDHKAPFLAGYWTFFGGRVDGDESPEQTVRRDMFDQTGYRPHRPAFFMKEKSFIDGIYVLTHIFIERYDESQPLILQRGFEYGWFPVSQALQLRITPERQRTLRKLERYLKKVMPAP